MPTYYDKICSYEKCKKSFQVLPRNKKQSFCSPQCSSKTKHHKESNFLRCDKQLIKSQKKYCSQSCAAIVNNTGIRRHGNPPSKCLQCGQLTGSSSGKYCSTICFAVSRTIRTEDERRKLNAQAQSRYRAKKLRVIHPTVNPEKIKEIYLNCPPGHEVDHKIPLSKGGLHHEDNLQYLTVSENRRKGNRYIG